VGLTVQLIANLVAGPDGCSEQQFPSSLTTIDFGLLLPQKPYAVTTGSQVVNVASPNTPVALPGIGSAGPVTQAHTFYARTLGSLVLVLTFNNPAGGTFTATIPLQGVYLVEPPVTSWLQGVTVQGTGQLEFCAWGQQ
jgi:hypothetical protein